MKNEELYCSNVIVRTTDHNSSRITSNSKRIKMTTKLLAQATVELILESPDKTEAIIDRVKKLVTQKYRKIKWNNLAEKITNMVARGNKITRYTVVSATPLDDNQKQDIENKLQGKTDISWKVDANILGGLIIKTHDRELDNSLISRISKYKKEFKNIKV